MPKIYTRAEIAALFAAHRRGEFKGRELDWARLEIEIVRASAEGRIVGALDVNGGK